MGLFPVCAILSHFEREAEVLLNQLEKGGKCGIWGLSNTPNGDFPIGVLESPPVIPFGVKNGQNWL